MNKSSHINISFAFILSRDFTADLLKLSKVKSLKRIHRRESEAINYTTVLSRKIKCTRMAFTAVKKRGGNKNFRKEPSNL